MSFSYKATIAVCSYNRSNLLQLCIKSVSEINFPKEDFEVLVVDNNSTDNTVEVCHSIPSLYPNLNFRYLVETKQGVGHARSRCAKEANGEIIAYIDDDCLADVNWLKEIVRFYDEYPEAMSTGGKIVPKYVVPVANWFGKYFWGLVGNYDLGDNVFQMKGVRYPSGANMHFRKVAFERYGYFDGNLGRSGKSLMAGEEKAMYLKLIENNEKVYYLPQVIVQHHVEGNKFDKSYVRKHSYGIGGSERLMNKNNVWKITMKFGEYVLKLGYAIIYGFTYLLKGEADKMIMLIKFRWWVIEGFLFPSKTK
jgi:glycosyltransferase involved in cell wall biosynthesis